jgi:toluene monooxygenase system protein E
MTTSDLAKPLRTWSHLATNRRRPTEYEIVSTNTLWNTPNHKLKWSQGGAVPVVKWRDKYRDGSPLKHDDWNAFRDPDQVVYRTYNLMQDGQETYIDGLLNEYNSNEHDLSLSMSWLAMLGKVYTPARYLIHATQMASGYLVALAPSSTVANPLMFQCADQLRWVSRTAYRTAELTKAHPDLGFGKAERTYWEDSKVWRGFLELAERALVAWDWGESFTAVNLVLKPAIDEAFMHQFGRVSRANGDTLTGMLLDAQFTDSERSRRFTAGLVNFLCAAPGHDNKAVMAAWVEKWAPLGDRAIDAFCAAFDEEGTAAAAAKQDAKAFRATMGFD